MQRKRVLLAHDNYFSSIPMGARVDTRTMQAQQQARFPRRVQTTCSPPRRPPPVVAQSLFRSARPRPYKTGVSRRERPAKRLTLASRPSQLRPAKCSPLARPARLERAAEPRGEAIREPAVTVLLKPSAAVGPFSTPPTLPAQVSGRLRPLSQKRAQPVPTHGIERQRPSVDSAPASTALLACPVQRRHSSAAPP